MRVKQTETQMDATKVERKVEERIIPVRRVRRRCGRRRWEGRVRRMGMIWTCGSNIRYV